MSHFREEFLLSVRDALKQSSYYPEDFELEQTADDEFKTLTITYRYHPAFRLQARIRTKPGIRERTIPILQQLEVESIGTIHVFSSPGKILTREHEIIHESDELIQQVASWVQRIDTELSAIPLNRKLSEQQRELDELTEQFAGIPEDFFSKEEAEDLKCRLDQFEEQFAESIRQGTADKVEANRRISSLHDEIQMLKRQLDTLNQKGWTRSALVRITNWARDPLNRQLLKSGGELAKELLLPAGNGGDHST